MPEQLSKYLDERLSAREVQSLEPHLEACSACREELDSLRDTVHLLRRLPEMAPRSVFTLSEGPAVRPASRTSRVPTWAYGMAASVVILVFAAVLSTDLSGLLEGEVSRDQTSRAVETVPALPTQPPEASTATQAAGERTLEPEAGAGALEAPEGDTAPPSGVAEEEAPVAMEALSATEMKAAVEPSEQVAALDAAEDEAPAEDTEAAATPTAAPMQEAQQEAGDPTTVPQEAPAEDGEAVAAPTPEPEPEATEEEAAPTSVPQPTAAVEAAAAPEGLPVEVPDGGTAIAWRILEGVLAGVGFLLVVGLFLRFRTIRKRSAV